MSARLKVDYNGEAITGAHELTRLGIEPDALYWMRYIEKFPTMVDSINEIFVMGKNLLSRLKCLRMRGDIRIQGPVRIVGEEQ